ncbi:MAG: rhomboid family intramembrane serine protease [Chthoniobacterales bacterium]
MRLSGSKASSYAQRWTSRHRVVLYALLGVQFVAFVAQLVVQAYVPGAIPEYLGLSYRGIDQAYAWEFLSAIFLHGSVLQFALNLSVLYFLGRDVESIFGQKHFLYLYFFGAIAGELGHLFLFPATTVLLAASGGFAAIVIAYGTILPELELAGSLFFFLPVKVKAKHVSHALFALAGLLLFVQRDGVITHSAWLGGGSAGWLYAHLLGFGRPSVVQRFLRERKLERERLRLMSWDDYITEEIDPLLEKISRRGLASLTRNERRKLAEVRAKMAAPAGES